MTEIKLVNPTNEEIEKIKKLKKTPFGPNKRTLWRKKIEEIGGKGKKAEKNES